MSNESSTRRSFYFENNDGGPAVTIYLENNELWHEGETALLPAERFIADNEEDATQELARRGTLLNNNGYNECIAPEKRFQAIAPIATAYDDGIIAPLRQFPARDDGTDMVAFIKEAYGIKQLTPELDALLNAVSAHDTGYHAVGEWRIWSSDFFSFDANRNWFEAIVELDQNNYLGTSLMEVFSRSVYLGSAGNGDTYHAHCCLEDPQRTEVLFYDHEEQSPSAMAESISALGLANVLLDECQEQDDEHEEDVDVFNQAMETEFEPLLERIDLSWHYRSLEEHADSEAEYSLKTNGLFFTYRARWVEYMLKQNGVCTLSDMEHMFYDGIHDTLKWENARQHKAISQLSPPALYWLWHLFWFNKDEALREHIANCKTSPARMVRDAAILVEELQDGRKNLGKIEDIHALREEFIALGLDPEEKEYWEAERARQVEELAAQEATEQQAGQALLDANKDNIPELKQALWNFDTNHQRHAITEFLIAQDGLLQARLSQDDEFSFEAITCNTNTAWYAAVLSENPRHLIGTPNIPEQLPRLQQLLRTNLVPDGEYNHDLERKLSALRFVDVAGQVDEIYLPLLQTLKYNEESDFTVRLSSKDSVRYVCDLIAQHPTELSTEWLFSNWQNFATECYPPLLKALGHGAQAYPTPERFAVLSQAFNDHLPASDYALAIGGGADELQLMLNHTSKQRGPIAYRIATLLHAQALRQRVEKTPVDADVITAALTTRLPDKYAAEELFISTIRVLTAQADNQSIQHIKSLLDVDLLLVRQTAIQALRSFDASFNPDYMDTARLEQLYAADGEAGLKAALLADDVIGRHHILAFIDEHQELDMADFEDEALQALRRIARFDAYPYPWDKDSDEYLDAAISTLEDYRSERIKTVLAQLIIRPENPLAAKAISDRKALDAQVQAAMAQRTGIDKLLPATSTPWVFGAGINGMAFLANGELLVAGNHGVVKMDTLGNINQRYLGIQGNWTYDITIHPDQTRAAASANGQVLQLLDIASGKTLVHYQGQSGGIRKAKFSPDGTRLASVSDYRYLCVWDVDSGEMLHEWHDAADVNGVDWLDNERIAIITDDDTQIISFSNKPEGERLAQQTGGGAEIHLGPENKLYAGIMQGKNAGITVMDQELNIQAKYPQTDAARIRFSQDGNTMYVIDWTGSEMGLWVYDLNSGEKTAIAGHSDGAPFAMDLHPNTDMPFVGGSLNTVKRWIKEGDEYLVQDSSAIYHNDEVEQIFKIEDTFYSVGGSHIIAWQRSGDQLLQTSAFSLNSDKNEKYEAAACNEDASRWLMVENKGGISIRDNMSNVLFSSVPDGRMETAAYANGNFAYGSGQNLHIINMEGKEIACHAVAVESTWINWLAATKHYFIACGYEDNTIHVFAASTGEQVFTIELPIGEHDRISAFDTAASAEKLLVAVWKQPTRVYDLNNPSDPLMLEHCVVGNTTPMAISDDASRYFFQGNSGYLLLDDDMQLLQTFDRAGSSEAFYVDQDCVIQGCADGSLNIRALGEQHSTPIAESPIAIDIPSEPKMAPTKRAAPAGDSNDNGGFNPFD